MRYHEDMTLEEISILVRDLEAEQEWRRRRRQRGLSRGLLLFLAAMAVMAFVCREFYSSRLPRVEWGYSVSGTLTSGIKAEGIIGTNSPRVVAGLDGLRIASIHVRPGEEVKTGTLLYELDREDLDRKLEELSAKHRTWQRRADNWYEDARTATAWFEAEQREARIEYLQMLADYGGLIRAGEDGVILEVTAKPGERMTEEPVMTYMSRSTPRMFQAVLSADQKKMVHTGDPVEIQFSGSKERVQGTIDWMEEKDGGYQVTVWLEQGVGEGELEASMELNYTSQLYDYLIPIEALHQENDRCCVYVLSEKDGILGPQLFAEKLEVRVLEKNQEKAAIAEELLDGKTKIITDASKDLEDGDVVREKE